MDIADLSLKMLVEIRDRLSGVEGQLAAVDGRLAAVETHVEAGFTELREGIHRLDVRLGETQVDVNRIQARLTRMDLVHRTRMDELELAYFEVREMDARVARCEADVAALKASRPAPP